MQILFENKQLHRPPYMANTVGQSTPNCPHNIELNYTKFPEAYNNITGWRRDVLLITLHLA